MKTSYARRVQLSMRCGLRAASFLPRPNHKRVKPVQPHLGPSRIVALLGVFYPLDSLTAPLVGRILDGMKKPKLVEYQSSCSNCDVRWDAEENPFRFCPWCGKSLEPVRVVYEPNEAGRLLLA